MIGHHEQAIRLQHRNDEIGQRVHHVKNVDRLGGEQRGAQAGWLALIHVQQIEIGEAIESGVAGGVAQGRGVVVAEGDVQAGRERGDAR